jgi:hypothetical protein
MDAHKLRRLFLCNLTFLNVPDGNQQIEVTAVKEGIYINWTTVPSAPTYWAFSMTTSAVFPFVTPTPTPQPTQTPQLTQVTPTPSVPELSWLMLLPLSAFTLAAAIRIKTKNQALMKF